MNSATHNRYILTLSCNDKPGIVAAVSGFLFEQEGFILESQQFGDPSTGRFFMRTFFEAGDKAPNGKAISTIFTAVAEKFGMRWEIHNVQKKPRVLIMVSKEGHCLNHLLYRWESGQLPIDIVAVGSNHPDLKHMADQYKVPFHYWPIHNGDKTKQESQILALTEELHIDVVALARYMQILSNDMCQSLKGRAINIHHSFLPSFKGANPYRQAYDRGVKIIGATAHYVTADLDEGPIIEQEVIRVDHSYSSDELRQMGQDVESRVLFRALQYHVEHRVLLNGQKTVVFR